MLGKAVRDSIYALLERNGIQRKDVASRFDDVVQVLMRSLGTCSRVVIYRTVAEMYKQYSQRMDFSYEDSLRDCLALLKESVVANHLVPGRLYESSTFDIFFENVTQSDSTGKLAATVGYNSLYPMKKGVKS